ncbi:ABC transporter substrate-binding protein [Haloarchaeobius sp. DFWS5]|uniref:ABC transporter substrate-binding protein n=1 Tax=Haloarchaeobius sp. DFWS5 TaxID=3446114 RepID=UPI003EB905E8
MLKTTGAVGALGLSAGCLSGLTGGDGEDSGSLEVLHGWADGDGSAAFKAMLEGFKEAHSDVDINAKSIGGSGNTSLDQRVNTRLGNDSPPGSWADWPGKNLLQFTSEDLLGDIEEDVWGKNDMKNAYLQGPKDAAKPDGKFVAVPINIHRMNNLFYNKSVVEEAGVDPSSISDAASLTDALKKVDENTDAVGMAQGGKKPWPTLQLWATVLLAQQGPSGYDKFAKGNMGQEPIAKAFETLVSYSDYYTDDVGTIGFQEAAGKVVNGKAAFIHQGDWVAGTFASQDFAYGDDWDYVPFPGTDGHYALNMDSFVFPSGSAAPEAAKKWLAYCGTKDAQIRFNKEKGSIPPRSDVSPDEFPEFQAKQMKDFKNSEAQPPSVAHGLAVSKEVLSNLKGAINNDFSEYSESSASAVAKSFTQAF